MYMFLSVIIVGLSLLLPFVLGFCLFVFVVVVVWFCLFSFYQCVCVCFFV